MTDAHRAAELLVLAAANDRFEIYMKERHYTREESVLGDVRSPGPANDLIRAVAKWRIATRSADKSTEQR